MNLETAIKSLLDYKIDLDEVDLHFWQFYDLMQGLTESSVLNRVRSIRELQESFSDVTG